MKKNPRSPKKAASIDPQVRTPFWRIKYIHDALRRKTWPNSTTLRKELGVCRGTLIRDIDFMRDSMDLPVEFDKVRNGYFYTREVNELPDTQVTEDELLALVVAQQVLESLKGTRLEVHLRKTFEKLTSRMDDATKLRWKKMASVISFRTTGSSTVRVPELFGKLRTTISNEQEITFLYTKLRATTPEQRLVRPLHLANVENAWYLLGYDFNRKDIRIFALHRMEEMSPTGRTFEEPQLFDLDEHLAHSIGIYSGERPTLVRLLLSEVAARLMQERQWHPSQQITRNAAGQAEMTLNVAVTPELERMIMSWGIEVKVLEPKSLREQIFENYRALLRMYGEDIPEGQA